MTTSKDHAQSTSGTETWEEFKAGAIAQRQFHHSKSSGLRFMGSSPDQGELLIKQDDKQGPRVFFIAGSDKGDKLAVVFLLPKPATKVTLGIIRKGVAGAGVYNLVFIPAGKEGDPISKDIGTVSTTETFAFDKPVNVFLITGAGAEDGLGLSEISWS